MKNDNIPDFPFAELLGLKPKKKLTPEQEIGKKLLEIAKQHKTYEKPEK